MPGTDHDAQFGDTGDSFTEGDEAVDWSKVEELADQITAIQDIEDDDARLADAKAWAKELSGGTSDGE